MLYTGHIEWLLGRPLSPPCYRTQHTVKFQMISTTYFPVIGQLILVTDITKWNPSVTSKVFLSVDISEAFYCVLSNFVPYFMVWKCVPLFFSRFSCDIITVPNYVKWTSVLNCILVNILCDKEQTTPTILARARTHARTHTHTHTHTFLPSSSPENLLVGGE
jgi:hypothetical protein